MIRVLLTLLVVLQASVLHAWDTTGHAVVALIAEPRLTPEARATVTHLLGTSALIKVASWADQVRTKQTAPWHYVNIELDEHAYDPTRHCPRRQCVIAQIERFRAILTAPHITKQKRQKALRYLIHFVADLHQPLHAGERHDRGGNDVKVNFLGQTINPSTKKPWNLHQVWDHGLLAQYAPDAADAAASVRRWLASQEERKLAEGTVVEWAIESHDLARDHAYRFGPDQRLDEQYLKQALPVVEAQLARAGVRLAHLLNTALTNGTARPSPKERSIHAAP